MIAPTPPRPPSWGTASTLATAVQRIQLFKPMGIFENFQITVFDGRNVKQPSIKSLATGNVKRYNLKDNKFNVNGMYSL